MHMRYLFGPVSSRRLGTSLGIDLLPFKTCSLDCIYCECGSTTVLTNERREYVPLDEVLSELDSYLATSPRLDYITFSGSGEPTLHSGIGNVIAHLKQHHSQYPVCVLTNSSLLSDPVVRRELLPADTVIPSLDAVSEQAFRTILRPHRSLTPEQLLAGITDFAEEYQGQLIIEIFIVPGVNDSAEEISRFRDFLAPLRIASVQLNTLARPGAVSDISPADTENLRRIAHQLDPVPVSYIAGKTTRQLFEDSFLEAVQEAAAAGRTLEQIITITGMRATDVMLVLEELVTRNELIREGADYYRAP